MRSGTPAPFVRSRGPIPQPASSFSFVKNGLQADMFADAIQVLPLSDMRCRSLLAKESHRAYTDRRPARHRVPDLRILPLPRRHRGGQPRRRLRRAGRARLHTRRARDRAELDRRARRRQALRRRHRHADEVRRQGRRQRSQLRQPRRDDPPVAPRLRRAVAGTAPRPRAASGPRHRHRQGRRPQRRRGSTGPGRGVARAQGREDARQRARAATARHRAARRTSTTCSSARSWAPSNTPSARSRKAST